MADQPMTYPQRSDLLAQKRALLKAVRVLTDHGHHVLAQELWEASANLKTKRVMLPGEY